MGDNIWPFQNLNEIFYVPCSDAPRGYSKSIIIANQIQQMKYQDQDLISGLGLGLARSAAASSYSKKPHPKVL